MQKKKSNSVFVNQKPFRSILVLTQKYPFKVCTFARFLAFKSWSYERLSKKLVWTEIFRYPEVVPKFQPFLIGRSQFKSKSTKY